MTNHPENPPSEPPGQSESLFGGLSDAELLRIRVRPATFARMVGCSKQSVSRWIRDGTIALSPIDGTLDPQAATAAILKRADPHRIRSRVLRSAAEELGELRRKAARLAELEPQLQAAQDELRQARDEIKALLTQRAADWGYEDAQAARIFTLCEAIRTALPVLDASRDDAARALAALLRAIDVEDQRDDDDESLPQ